MLRVLAECAEIGRRESHKSRILARLQQGPASGRELATITHRFGARLAELREDLKPFGYLILTDHDPATGESTYTLTREG